MRPPIFFSSAHQKFLLSLATSLVILHCSITQLFSQNQIQIQVTQTSYSPPKLPMQGKIEATSTTLFHPIPPPKMPAQDVNLEKAKRLPKSIAEWETESYDFGKIIAGKSVTYSYTFKNKGQSPLEITYVKPSCGCTTSNWSKSPIPPGQEGFVELTFNSSGKSGAQSKTVTVYMNTEPITKILRFKGEIISP